MKIGILGAGNIGGTLTRRLSASGHQITVANSRGPQTIPTELLVHGARAVDAQDVARDAEVLILSVPLTRLPEARPLLDDLPTDAVVIDTSNYYPSWGGPVPALEDGQTVESQWVVEQLGRPVVKAWNAILTSTFDDKATQAGAPGRIAVPVAADDPADRALGMRLVDETGFDAVDSGSLAESWRQQPGTPAFCTELTRDELVAALAAAVPGRAPRRRDLALSVIGELTTDTRSGDDGQDVRVQVNRLIYS
jgi:8-hydroxy-5-deazaflavin:NADPH oxidoreductase